MEYKNNKGLEAIQAKDKRISYLSILSSLTHLFQGSNTTANIRELSEIAYKLNEELYKKYKFPEFPETDKLYNPPKGQMNHLPDFDAGEGCPKCDSPMKYREGIKNGRKWRGYFCTNRGCKYVSWLRKQTRQETERVMAEDNFQEEANQNYEGEIPPEFR